MQLDKTELGIISAILKTHVEMQDNQIVRLATDHLPNDIAELLNDLEEDSEVMSELATKVERMIHDAPAES